MKNLLVLLAIGLFAVGCSNDDFDELQAQSECNKQARLIMERYTELGKPFATIQANGGTLTPAQWNEWNQLALNQKAEIAALACNQ